MNILLLFYTKSAINEECIKKDSKTRSSKEALSPRLQVNPVLYILYIHIFFSFISV